MMVPMFNKIVCLLVLVQLAISTAQKEIYDPRGIFCGKMSCYDVLNITRKSPPREVKRAYRRLSLENHPDKNKADNATKIFKRIAKAYEVLIGNESRPLFDYYLDHPRDYFKVSGHHYFRNLPKSDVRLVIFLVACLLSWFFYVMQNQKYEAAMKSIKTAMANVSGASQPKQITDLQNRAAALYEDYIKKGIIKQPFLLLQNH
jgi:DnaJ domain